MKITGLDEFISKIENPDFLKQHISEHSGSTITSEEGHELDKDALLKALDKKDIC